MTWRAVQTSQARAFGPVTLWVLEVCAVMFVAGSVFVLVVSPGEWGASVFAIVFFGACAAVLGYMIVLQRRPAPPPSS